MAPADSLSAPGTATYASDTLVVGDGTWDFTKNTFLLPNLMGLNIDTMRYNGMGNRFSTVEQYHQLITGHGILAVITFLFVIPAAVMYARFRPHGSSLRLHAYLQVFAVLLSTVVFILGYFAVGPSRSLTNPHHGIGVAIYTMIMVQIVGGRLVKHIRRKSFRLMLHRWLGRAVAILGIVQIPLGLTLYGSPLYTFILFAVWMAILFLIYFVLSWRHESNRERTAFHGDRSEVTESERKSEHDGGWLGPLALGAGIWALMRGRKKHEDDLDGSMSRSSRSRAPEVIPSQRGSESYMDEKISERTDRPQGGGITNWLLGLAGLVGAGSLVKGARDKRERRRYDDEEYSAVPTDTPSRFSRPSRTRKTTTDQYTESEFSDDRTELHARPRPHTPLLPGPRNPAATTVLSGTDTEPMTPRPLHSRPPPAESSYISDYSSYVSPSRRAAEDEKSSVAKGVLATIGLGWLAKKMKGSRDEKAEEERRRMEDERRDGRRGSKFTGDGYSTPTRSSRRRPPAPSALTATTYTADTESSMLEARPPGTSVSGPPMPPLGPRGAQAHAPAPAPAPVPVPVPGPHSHSHSHSRSRSRSTRNSGLADPISMPAMPPDPHGVLHPIHSATDSFASSGGGLHRQGSSRHRSREDAAAAAAASSLAAEEEDRRRRDRSQSSTQPVSVKVRYHDDRDRNITLRRLTEQEAEASRRGNRGRSDSISSISDSEAPSRRYRRDSSSHRTGDEAATERLVSSEPMSPPTPVAAGGRRAGKDSAYYSGQPGPSGGMAMANPTISSIATDSHAWSGMSPSASGQTGTPASIAPSAAERRRRRRLERRDQRPGSGTVDYS
ncbi:uncharacterized protein GGS22DRAFT_52977 [Annulohypoxylon maeteangense]|uniref:uncharacterized protein n=1 Tax=Annulohypoxylon maeteangense TaxID=1927788 RepID=UPI002007E5A7|nr:uncharacterized protein GGS22DRAFT_52977 [Annulohypoxylon maeteangense]KAI0881961.1 hypothetical protein GGS22DRAFT_52977 [Annulohypoxylon maeteangense]